MSKKPNKSLENLNQAHGKDESQPAPTTLDQIWGDSGLWRYNTKDVDEYKTQLHDMTLADISEHANKIGLIPVGDRINLEKKLVDEFKKHMSKYAVSASPPKGPQKMSDEVKKILKEGQ